MRRFCVSRSKNDIIKLTYYMKNLFAIAAVAAMLVACAGNNANNANNEASAEAPACCAKQDSAKCDSAKCAAADTTAANADSTATVEAEAEN